MIEIIDGRLAGLSHTAIISPGVNDESSDTVLCAGGTT